MVTAGAATYSAGAKAAARAAGQGGSSWSSCCSITRLQVLQVRKMWLLMCAAALLVLAQYRVSSSWLVGGPAVASLPGVGDGGGGVVGGGAAGRGLAAVDALSNERLGLGTAPPTPATVTLDALEEAVRNSVERLALNNMMAAGVGARLLRDVASQLQLQLPTSQSPGNSQECNCDAAPLPGRAPPRPGATPLYVVTPTYRRPEQLAELTRMAQTLLLVHTVRWIVIEDAKAPSKPVARLLEQSGLQYEHLTAAMPEQYRKRKGAKPKGVAQRNRGLEWLRANATRGVFYFADDDNTYDVAIFEEIRSTQRVSMFPVGLCTKFGLSTPVVSSSGTFIGFYDGWLGGRKFPVDMAGFAVSVPFLHQRPKAQMPYSPGFEEDGFLKSLAPFEPKEIELKADNCTRVLVWHTQTKANAPAPAPDMAKYNQTNLAILKPTIV